MLRFRKFLYLVAFVNSVSQAQCPKRTELLALVDSEVSQPDDQDQVQRIRSLLESWERCHYAKDSSYVNVSLELAKTYFRRGDVTSAIQNIEQTIRIYNNSTPALKQEDLVKAYYRLGAYWKEINNYNKAEEAFKKAVEFGKQVPNSSWTSFAYQTLAYIYYSKGEYQKAIQYAEQSRTCAVRAHDNVAYLEAWIEKIKGLIALNQRTYAQRAIDSALTAARNDANVQYCLARLLMYNANLAMLNRSTGRALTNFKDALRINQSLGKNKGIVDNCIEIGYLLYQIKDYNQAETYYQLGLKTVEDPYVKLRLLNNLGAIYWQKKQYVKALTYYQAGLNAVPIRFRNTDITALPKAELIRNASQEEFLLTLIQDKADTWLDYAKATSNRDRFRWALETYKVADRMIDYMRWEHTGQQSKLFWRNKTRGIYERAIETCYRLGDGEQALRFFEKSRAVMLADKLNELGARQQLSKELAQKESQFRQAVSDAQSELANKTSADADYDKIQATLTARQDQLDAFIKRLEVSNPTYFQNKYDTTTTKLIDLQRYLRQREATFVSYFVGDSAVYVLGVEPDRVRLLRLNQSVPTYKRDVRSFVNLLSNPGGLSTKADLDRLTTLGNSIYQQTLAPLKLPAGCVIVSPDRFFVPFEALSSSANQAKYLVNTYAFDYAYSARLLLRKNEQSAPALSFRNDGFLGFAPVEFAARLGQVTLPGSDKALEAIGERFRNAKLFTHKVATRQAFLTEAAHARVIQLFTHAVADSTEREPLLYFADDTLRLSDLANGEPLRAQLAVLGACQTGVGADQVGEGVFSLARGFASLGVPSIVSTLWSVQDQATYQLTELFHQYMDEGLPKDIALQRAKQEWLRTHSGVDQLPNVWAGLILIGDPQPLRQPSRWPWAVAAVLLGVGGAGLWWRQRRAIKPAASSRLPV